MPTQHTILVVNPGSTSTKIARSTDGSIIERETILHPTEEIQKYKTLWDQFPYRLKICEQWASERITECSAVVSMGGLLRPVEGGTYLVNDKMLADSRANLQGEHASNLGCALAQSISLIYNCPAYIIDPVSVDEFEPLACYSGHPKIKRRSLSHALNIHAAARRAAEELKLPLSQSFPHSGIICHLGGGISIAPVRDGKIIDVNDASSDGPFSPERTGGLPLQPFISLCFSKEFNEQDIRKLVMGKGGLVAYLGTNSVIEVEKRIESGDKEVLMVYQAMAYQIAKEIGAMATVLRGKVDAIVLTGGIANSKMLLSWIEERVRFIAPILIYPGEDEMQALTLGALRVLRGEEEAKEY
ncbi:MAG: butyrate kinase [Bacteroidota bacterium]|nr:butyrate kinase [Bacteroidota bacterium]